jgi:hypothetical protein
MTLTSRTSRITRRLPLISALCAATLAFGAAAQTPTETLQRDVHQQQRILGGLQDGSLTTDEAARLQRDQARVDRLQSRALRDGELSPTEARRLDHAQDAASLHIRAARHNDREGNPDSASSQRSQAATERNVHQADRIADGAREGQLTNREIARLERGQARSHGQQARQGRDGQVSARENLRRDATQDRQSVRIHRGRHNGNGAQG